MSDSYCALGYLHTTNAEAALCSQIIIYHSEAVVGKGWQA